MLCEGALGWGFGMRRKVKEEGHMLWRLRGQQVAEQSLGAQMMFVNVPHWVPCWTTWGSTGRRGEGMGFALYTGQQRSTLFRRLISDVRNTLFKESLHSAMCKTDLKDRVLWRNLSSHQTWVDVCQNDGGSNGYIIISQNWYDCDKFYLVKGEGMIKYGTQVSDFRCLN